VVCNLEGVPVARCLGGDVLSFPGRIPEASDGHHIDMNTIVVLGAQNQVVGSTENVVARGGGTPVGAGHSQRRVSRERSPRQSTAREGPLKGHRQSNGLLYAPDGSVVGSCAPVVAEGLAVVSTSGDIIGNVSADGVVTSSAGARSFALRYHSSNMYVMPECTKNRGNRCRGGHRYS
jgi:hypothetical protein